MICGFRVTFGVTLFALISIFQLLYTYLRANFVESLASTIFLGMNILYCLMIFIKPKVLTYRKALFYYNACLLTIEIIWGIIWPIIVISDPDLRSNLYKGWLPVIVYTFVLTPLNAFFVANFYYFWQELHMIKNPSILNSAADIEQSEDLSSLMGKKK